MACEIPNALREILHLHVGSAGIEIGNQCWELYCLEHNLDVDGRIAAEQSQDVPPKCFFLEWNADTRKKYRPQALFVDVDSSAIDNVKTSKYRNLYTDSQFFTSTDSCSLILDGIRKQVEVYDNFQGFALFHSTYGTCSSFTSQLLKNLTSEYSKKITITNSVFGSSVNASSMYNLLKYAHVVIPMENKAIYSLCKQRLDIDTPTYSNVNKLIAMCWSNITCSMRFDGYILADLNEFQTTLVPYPAMKMLSSYLLPLIPFSFSTHTNFISPSVYDMCTPLFSQPNTCFIHQFTPYKMTLAVNLLFRGENIVPKEVGQKLIMDMKKWWRFSDGTPTGFRCGINYQRTYIFGDKSDVALTDKQVCVLANQTATSKHLCETSLNQCDKFTKDEEEQTEVIEAHDYLQGLRADYQQIETEIIQDHELDMTTSFVSEN
ncbi:unnamed protein product [Didymodactylos carnosus]|uniref:Tubulin/FtsZ GTPase domain-containing protein n=1 Tax=Didymodactylos carnosus TaxID=1234261 RepID=A0A815H3T6_9BILA|nr:unnamed protein product [Didymodactylos carnosus]CAF1346397.1 unnamed protein product [Didymodactylos carnosus]CAF3637754.1 unnamed protein product [Didymodactylos carnosus]CAF4212513.1 unnamed protein product [Didymodactylos carnosus]